MSKKIKTVRGIVVWRHNEELCEISAAQRAGPRGDPHHQASPDGLLAGKIHRLKPTGLVEAVRLDTLIVSERPPVAKLVFHSVDVGPGGDPRHQVLANCGRDNP
jgi:hypothetical protein